MSTLPALRYAASWLLRLRPATIEHGPAKGLRIDMRQATAPYDLGYVDLPVQEWLAAHLRPGMVFYDVGAGIGFHSLLAARLVGEAGTVLAFEPIARCADAVRRNADLNGFEHLLALEFAVSWATGETEMFHADDPVRATLVHPGPERRDVRTQRIRTVTLDGLVEREEYPKPDVVRVCVAGAELKAIEGMKRLAAARRPLVLFEIEAPSVAELHARLDRVHAALAPCGYDSTRLPDSIAGTKGPVAHLAMKPRTTEGRGER